MNEVHRLEAKGLARAKSRSRRRRIAAIRSRTIRSSLALFAILWTIVFVQLASGNDPVLSRNGQVERHSGTPAPVPAEPVREPAPEAIAEAEVEPVEEFEAAPQAEAPIVTSSS
jgi:hypothetical protein